MCIDLNWPTIIGESISGIAGGLVSGLLILKATNRINQKNDRIKKQAEIDFIKLKNDLELLIEIDNVLDEYLYTLEFPAQEEILSVLLDEMESHNNKLNWLIKGFVYFDKEEVEQKFSRVKGSFDRLLKYYTQDTDFSDFNHGKADTLMSKLKNDLHQIRTDLKDMSRSSYKDL